MHDLSPLPKRRSLAPRPAMASSRRRVLKLLAAGGVALPAAYLALSRMGSAELAPSAWADALSAREAIAPSALPASLSVKTAAGPVLRDFADPVLELARLLRQAAEVEHALLLQYLYAALSLKPAYEAVAGYGAPGATDLLGVAVQEMQHLGAVNQMLVALGNAPHLSPLEFPFEPAIYPFAFNLEPLSRHALARYVYCEAPTGTFHGKDPESADGKFAAQIADAIGADARPNHIGSLYSAIIDIAGEIGRNPDPELPPMEPWIKQLHAIQNQGEEDHFHFFKALFLGSHPGFAGQKNVWDLPVGDPNYPAYPLLVNPTAFARHQNQIGDASTLALAWLGNLQYWTALLLLDHYFRFKEPAYRDLAVAHMMGPVLSLGRHLPKLGTGLPFDPIDLPYSSGTDKRRGLRLVLALLKEGQLVAEAIEKSLPSEYPLSLNQDSASELRRIVVSQK